MWGRATGRGKPSTGWRHGDATGFVQEAGIRPGDRLVMDEGLRWQIRTTMAFAVLDGRIWTRDLAENQAPPPQADVAVLPLSDEQAPATDSWRSAPPGWHVDRDVRGQRYVVWRRG
ncbi:hypothetical protein ACIPUC_01620 [Streptomyces sp. LARHCF249]